MEVNAEEALWRLFAGVIPERNEELKEYLTKYAHHFSRCEDKPGFVMDAGPYGILRFTHRTMRMMWLLGFAAQQTLHVYGGLVFLLMITQQKFTAEILEGISDQDKEINRYNQLIDAVYELSRISKFDDFIWPDWIPIPEDGPPQNDLWASTRDLVLMAGAYVFLHEIKHIIFADDREKRPANVVEEEIECDRFARKLMLGELSKYTEGTGEPIGKVRDKRATSMILAIFFMLVITPKNAWNGTQTHPSIEDRVMVIVEELEIPENGAAWIYLVCVCLAQLQYVGETPEEISFNSYKDLGLALLKRIR